MNIAKIIVFLLVLQMSFSIGAEATPLEEYREAQSNYLEVAASLAAYNDRYGKMAFSALEQAGWEIHYFNIQAPSNDAKFIFMEKIDKF